ncbi:NYN domain-containing protein [candidate division CSSED10-310 bacterium]|uniref:NYN domain-containing protein n=1 Tax=candidate division CSSED10-310 bacterium TaxID=2855610 RepID=A0ABV6YZD1_UNCC1
MGGNTLIIDGFNVIYSDFQLRAMLEQNLSEAQAQFIDLIEFSFKSKKISIYIVFDGQYFSHHKRCRNISVIYSKASQTADQIIIKLVRKHTSSQSVTVVTSDQGIIHHVQSRRCKVISARAFLSKIAGNSNQPAGDKIPEPKLSPDEVDEWLRIFEHDEEL